MNPQPPSTQLHWSQLVLAEVVHVLTQMRRNARWRDALQQLGTGPPQSSSSSSATMMGQSGHSGRQPHAGALLSSHGSSSHGSSSLQARAFTQPMPMPQTLAQTHRRAGPSSSSSASATATAAARQESSPLAAVAASASELDDSTMKPPQTQSLNQTPPGFHAATPQSQSAQLVQSFARLRELLETQCQLQDVDLMDIMRPFIQVVLCADTTGPITAAALASVERLLLGGIIGGACS